MASTTYTFTTAGNYTASDSDKIEVTGGSGTLSLQQPADITFGANFGTDTDGTFGDGTLTATEVGTPTVSGGKMTLNANLESARWPGQSKLASDYTCTMRGFFSFYESLNNNSILMRSGANAGNNNTRFDLYYSSGSIYLQVYDSGGTLSSYTGYAWGEPASDGTVYEVEMSTDGTTHRLYIDGTRQIEATDATTMGTVDGSSFVSVAVGGDNNFECHAFYVWDTVQHTGASYTVIGQYGDTVYDTTSPSLLTDVSITGNISAFSATEVTAGSDTVTYAVQVGGTDYYWTGSAWATSSGSSQANSASDVNTNVALLDTGNSAVKIKTYLYSDDGSTTPTIDELTLTYDATDTSATEPTFCYLEGYLYDHNGPVASQLIEVRPYLGWTNSEVFINGDWQTFDTTAADGYFGARIWDSASVGGQYEFRIGSAKYRFAVPDATSAKFSNLTITRVVAD